MGKNKLTYSYYAVIFFLVFVVSLFSCVKKEAEFIETKIGRLPGDHGKVSNELFPLKINNNWTMLLVDYDTLGHVVDSFFYTFRIKNQMILQKSNDTFYSFDGKYYKNEYLNLVTTFDTGFKEVNRIKVGVASLETIGNHILLEENIYKRFQYRAFPVREQKYGYNCYVIQKYVTLPNGKLDRIVNEYFKPNIGFVAKDVWRSKQEDGSTTNIYLRQRQELINYYLY